MASLMEELIQVMSEEIEVYKNLIPIADEKTRVIIRNDLDSLQEITSKEQFVVEQITVLEKQREKVIDNIALVINKKPDTLTMKTIIELLEKQPKEQKQLMKIYDELKKTVDRLVLINDKNNKLIEASLEMISFQMNVIQSSRMISGNTYTKGANRYEAPSYQAGMFDAKQ